MGGKGSGGHRVGAGRKPKSKYLRSIDGGASHRSGKAPDASSPAPIDEFDAPDDLTMDERRVWLRLAPQAFKNRTLTVGTALAFEMLCRNIVTERALGLSDEKAGADHRGIIQRVDNGLTAFGLRPLGKAIYQAEEESAKPVNPLSRFTQRRA
jgi:hypothetical protein